MLLFVRNRRMILEETVRNKLLNFFYLREKYYDIYFDNHFYIMYLFFLL